MPEQDYETNAYTIRNAADKRAQARRAKTLKAKRTARQKHIDRVIAANDITSSEIWSWLSRYGHTMPHGLPSEEVKARRSENGRRAVAIAAVKRRFCQHGKKAPKLRASGKFAGQHCCPSCWQPVGPEVVAMWEAKNREEDLVL